MSTTTSDTSAIDEVRETNSTTQSLTSSVVSFFITFLVFMILVFSQFSLGGAILYWSKLAESNILPTEDKCFPYTNNKPNIEAITSNIFINNSNGKTESMKINFPYDNKNSKNTILDLLREMKEKPNPSNITHYFISIIEKLISFDYSAFNMFFNFFNNLPEIITIMFGPFVSAFYAAIVFLCSIFYFIYLWFSQMSWFFKQNNSSKNETPKWGDVTLLDPVNYSISLGKIFLFCIVFIFVAVIALPIIPLFCIVWCLASLFSYNSVMYNKNTTILTIIKEVLKNYKVTITTIVSLFLILSVFANFGTIPGGVSIFIVMLIYWGIISIDIFKPIPPENLSPYIEVEQAKKTCKIVEPKEHGFLYNLVFGQNGGSQLVRDLKKLNKKLNNN